MNRFSSASACVFTLVIWGLAGLATSAASADDADKKKTKKPEPPSVILSLPLAVSPGTNQLLVVRGLNLTNAAELKFLTADPGLVVELKSREKAEVPKPLEAKQAGDSQLQVSVFLPANFPINSLRYVVTGPDGASGTNTLVIVPSDRLVGEREVNGGFGSAQEIRVGDVVSGTILSEKDVDVFRFQGVSGQRIFAEIQAARFGSALDAILMLHDQQGQPLATVDDAQGRDPTLAFTLPGDGRYFITVIDAHDRGSVVHPYLLELVIGEPVGR